MKLLCQLFIISILGIISITNLVYAQLSYDINIPTGAADPAAPYFWQSEKDGNTSGNVAVLVGDEIVWKNADTSAHTVTSGTPNDGPDGIFNSGLLAGGETFPYIFSEKGQYPYYCTIHPWMIGTITVTEGYSIIPEVGKTIGNGLTTFDVEYKFNRLLSVSSINEDKKSITFEIIGNAKSDNDNLLLRLPTELIDGPFVIWIDGKEITDFEQKTEDNYNVLSFELPKNAKMMTIIGTHIIPEFGIIVMAIFGTAIIGIVITTRSIPLQNRL